MRSQYPVQFLVMAKAPVPGRVKTRLCPPCTPEQAAAVAAAALTDTVTAVDGTAAIRHTLVLSGLYPAPPGWHVVTQRVGDLGERLAHGYADTRLPGVASVLVGMDTPQLTPRLLRMLVATLRRADAVLAPAEDGGWWALGLREPGYASILTEVPMSTDRTGELTLTALCGLGLSVAIGPTLRDVDTAPDAWAVAETCAGESFPAAVRRHVPPGTSRPDSEPDPAPTGIDPTGTDPVPSVLGRWRGDTTPGRRRVASGAWVRAGARQ